MGSWEVKDSRNGQPRRSYNYRSANLSIVIQAWLVALLQVTRYSFESKWKLVHVWEYCCCLSTSIQKHHSTALAAPMTTIHVSPLQQLHHSMSIRNIVIHMRVASAIAILWMKIQICVSIGPVSAAYIYNSLYIHSRLPYSISIAITTVFSSGMCLLAFASRTRLVSPAPLVRVSSRPSAETLWLLAAGVNQDRLIMMSHSHHPEGGLSSFARLHLHVWYTYQFKVLGKSPASRFHLFQYAYDIIDFRYLYRNPSPRHFWGRDSGKYDFASGYRPC